MNKNYKFWSLPLGEIKEKIKTGTEDVVATLVFDYIDIELTIYGENDCDYYICTKGDHGWESYDFASLGETHPLEMTSIEQLEFDMLSQLINVASKNNLKISQ